LTRVFLTIFGILAEKVASGSVGFFHFRLTGDMMDRDRNRQWVRDRDRDCDRDRDSYWDRNTYRDRDTN